MGRSSWATRTAWPTGSARTAGDGHQSADIECWVGPRYALEQWGLRMRRLILAALFLVLGHAARAACPSVLTDCPNINANNGAFGGTLTAPGLLGTPGNYLNGSIAVPTSSTQIFAATARVRVKLLNNSGIGGSGGPAIVIWCRWGAVSTPGGIGSFALQPNGGGIDDQGSGVNQLALNCLSESGTPSLYAEQY